MFVDVKEFFTSFIENFKITSGISAANCVSVAFLVISAIIVWHLLHKIQVNIGRNELVYNVERHINELYSSRYGYHKKGKKYKRCVIRFLLHDFEPWGSYNKDKRIEKKGQRYIRIRDKYSSEGKKRSREYISTQALHEMMIIFREVDKLKQSHIMKDKDLADLHHELLPWLVSGRIKFINECLGKNDAEVIGRVCFFVVRACKRRKNQQGIEFVKKYFINCQNDSEGILNYIAGGSKWKIVRWYRIHTFCNIINGIS